jgi:hypothetical protein
LRFNRYRVTPKPHSFCLGICAGGTSPPLKYTEKNNDTLLYRIVANYIRA